MPRHFLKYARVALAVLVFAGLALALVDFRGFTPPLLGHGLAQIQFVPGLVSLLVGGGMGAVVFVVGVLVALAVGRIYCSAICPLGILQDIVARLGSWFRRKKKFLPYAKPFTKLRHVFLWGTVAAAIAGWGGFALALLDPYSNFGRIVSMLARPLLTVANNAVVGLANAAGLQSVFRVEPAWAGAGLLLFPAAFLTVVVVMSALRGRLYCNTVCPVGTALGLVSRFAAFRIAIDKTACTKCGDCLRSCKAQCIDLRNGTVDASRCVACYNCIGVCDEAGIKYRFSWKPSSAKSAEPADPARRNFLASVAASALASTTAVRARADDHEEDEDDEPTGQGHGRHRGRGKGRKRQPTLVEQGAASRAISPPGSASVAQFLDRCTACHLCISACPTHVLQPALFEYGVEGLFRPHLNYAAAYCLFECTRCGEVCPDGAIAPLDLAAKAVAQIGVADLYMSRCVVKTNGTDCAACSEHCPTKAITTEPYRGNPNLRRPVLNQALCIGCGACEYACPVKPVKAIIVTGRREHAQAEKLVEKKATAPVQSGDFPF